MPACLGKSGSGWGEKPIKNPEVMVSYLKCIGLLSACLLISQIAEGQNENCCNIPVQSIAHQIIPESAFRDGETRLIKVYFHVYRDDNGNNGQTQSRIDGILQNLNIAYEPTGISFFYYPCETRWVNDTGLFNSDDECDFFVHNRHMDGVDIHVKGDGANSIAIAAAIPSNEFLVGGKRLDGSSIVQSSSVLHEMGHCLGLFHTHHGTCYEPSGVSCDGMLSGSPTDMDDFVEDTPTDPGEDPPSPDCVYQNDPVCEEGIFHPLTDNIMSYYWYNCRTKFTDGQCARMMELIPTAIIHATQNPCACDEDPDPCVCDEHPDPCMCPKEPPIYIHTNTPYDADMEIYGDVFIDQGATLTITARIKLGPQVSIFVEDNSKLILDGGILTACGDLWQGVKIAGQFDLGSLSPVGSANLKRGYVELKNSAVIEKAIAGIDGRDLFVTSGDINPGMQFYHGGGKITISSGSTIQYCGIGVRLARYGWGSLIGAGATGPGYPIGYEDEESAFSNSFFKHCTVAIYSDQNIGLSLVNNVFGINYTDYEGYLSSIRAIDNDFTSLSYIGSEHPLIPGSTFTDNTFTNSVLQIDGQGNTRRHIFKHNSLDVSSLWLTSELLYGVSENAFSNSGYVGLFNENTGENLRNWVTDNSFSGQKYAISVYGENNTEYLANCFSNTTYADLEINNGASIYLKQGSQQASAGNCFNYYGRIKTGNGISPFEYWTKDGYHASCQPVLNCKYPGACNGFTLSQSQIELDVDCETNIIGEPPSELNCECDSGLTGCTDAIASVRSSILGIGTGPGSALLTAQYRRCLDKLIREYVDTALASGEVEDVIDFLSAQPEFRYRVMAYGIMTHNLQYERASVFLDTLATSRTEEEAFVNVQKIWLDYITNIDSFTLSPTDSLEIRAAGESFNPLAGYARTVFYKLTGKRIIRDFIHIDSTLTPRSSNEKPTLNSSRITVEFHVWPNPVIGHDIDIQLNHADPGKQYLLVVYDAFGKMCSSTPITNGVSSLAISDKPGLYIICLLQDGEWIHTKRVVRTF